MLGALELSPLPGPQAARFESQRVASVRTAVCIFLHLKRRRGVASFDRLEARVAACGATPDFQAQRMSGVTQQCELLERFA